LIRHPERRSATVFHGPADRLFILKRRAPGQDSDDLPMSIQCGKEVRIACVERFFGQVFVHFAPVKSQTSTRRVLRCQNALQLKNYPHFSYFKCQSALQFASKPVQPQTREIRVHFGTRVSTLRCNGNFGCTLAPQPKRICVPTTQADFCHDNPNGSVSRQPEADLCHDAIGLYPGK
jgi:hypothetical protein